MRPPRGWHVVCIAALQAATTKGRRMSTRTVNVHLDRIRRNVADHDDPNWPFPVSRKFGAAAMTQAPAQPLRADARPRSDARPGTDMHPPAVGPAAVAGVAAAAALGVVGAFLAGRQLVRRARRFDLADKLVLITGG